LSSPLLDPSVEDVPYKWSYELSERSIKSNNWIVIKGKLEHDWILGYYDILTEKAYVSWNYYSHEVEDFQFLEAK